MPADIEKYRKYVDRFDITEAQKVELIHTLWSIMESFVDRAFGVHPAQLCRKETLAQNRKRRSNGVRLPKPSVTARFKGAAARNGLAESDKP